MTDNVRSARLSIEQGVRVKQTRKSSSKLDTADLEIYLQAARIHISDSGSPTRVIPERTLSRYQSVLPSDSGQDLSPVRQSLADSLRLLPSSMTGHQASQGPFLSLPNTPERNASGVWAFHNPGQSDFIIWEDSQRRLSPPRHAPISFFDVEEDKENIYATVSDYDTSEGEETTRNHLDWTQADLSPRDVFGLPIGSHFGRLLADTSGDWYAGDMISRNTSRHGIFSPPAPTPTVTNFRLNMRAVLRDEDGDEDEEWGDYLSITQIQELQELGSVYTRSVEQRAYDDRHLPMRDANGQGQANVFLGARRVTEYQRHQDRRRHEMEED
ncbi:uncharacterized protein N7477_003400 [Penicillium maclennaniae]|uniref:uncharacterized protein n=1 Tax=Penicillium maclennaniae TaxID=1343394 RepID=UPI002540321B|nr:uncharacterized protein N7477_003400 [Penicillium maclennaniae]KAJ5677767.1 hypothetical protein N7477_003400 [Penicillium maclennaniae]